MFRQRLTAQAAALALGACLQTAAAAWGGRLLVRQLRQGAKPRAEAEV